MKAWGIVIGIILILAILCSPVLAISKSDLIAYYRTTPESPVYPDNTPVPAENPEFIDTQGYLPFPNDILPFPKWAFPGGSDYNIFSTQKQSLIFSLRPRPYPDIPVGKPNIYLYGDHDLTARVRLAPENAITVSEPVYQPGKGWQAEVRNGSLNGAGDFLFYEGLVPDSGWQKNEGYVIRAEYHEQDMADMLGQYGFNEKETVEFIDYWASHLVEDVDYVFYPQETGAVDGVMPLSISPKPDQVSRIWFYAEPLVLPPEPVTHPEKIVREGFYVVEWGVIIQNEYWINHSPASSDVLL
jgi:hypothetical protein